MKSFKASEQGRAKIRQAREQITQEKGWAIDYSEWLEEASSFLPQIKNGKNITSATVSIGTWKRFLAGKAIKPMNFKAFCQVLKLNWEEIVDKQDESEGINHQNNPILDEARLQKNTDSKQALQLRELPLEAPETPTCGNLELRGMTATSKCFIAPIKKGKSKALGPSQDWGEAIDASIFYGRSQELTTLKQWIVQDKCRLVGLLGMGGIGKTALSVKFAQIFMHEFECVIWRSLQNSPPVEEILVSLLQFFGNEQQTSANLPESTSLRITKLINCLRSKRCLIILDNLESILQPGASAGEYRPGFEGYGELIKRLGETFHISCLMLTSREKPRELAFLEGAKLPIRSLEVTGLNFAEAQAIFKFKSIFYGTEDEWQELIQHYGGNPLVLQMVASGVKDVFGDSISEFVKLLKTGTFPFVDISQLLESQFKRLTDSEKELIYWLSLNRKPISISELINDINCPAFKQELLEILKSLKRKSLIENCNALFTLQPLVMEYAHNQLVCKLCDYYNRDIILAPDNLELLKAAGQQDFKSSENRLIFTSIKDRLLNTVISDQNRLENQLKPVKSGKRSKYPRSFSYKR
jgi:NB-ARC domain